jgi:hypothetical protein
MLDEKLAKKVCAKNQWLAYAATKKGLKKEA